MRWQVLLVFFGLVFAVAAPAATPHARHAAANLALAAATARDGGRVADPAQLNLKSASVLVLDSEDDKVLYAHNADIVTPIASITKLMTAVVVLDANQPLDEQLTVEQADIDTLKATHSRLLTGTKLTRRELLKLALMASENRAAGALGRNYPDGKAAFVEAMNRKAAALGMTKTHYVDPCGLSEHNVSTAEDLVKIVRAASGYELIREFTTTAKHAVTVKGQRQPTEFRNTNRLIQGPHPEWKVELSKTGYTAEAGRCLVMKIRVGRQPVIMVFLNAWGKLSPVGDATRVRRWLERHPTERG
jgi:D-alanyl-D-alanine endopeptidase (penicillin-binding protein 7)